MSRQAIAALLVSTMLGGAAAAQQYGAPQYGQPSPYGQTQYGQGQYAPSGPALAQQETRINQLEEQIRQLTGRVEELTHEIRQTRQQMERAQRDTDFRLSEIERGGARPAAAAEARPEPARSEASRPEPSRAESARPAAPPTPLPASGEAPPPGQARVIAPPGPGTTTPRPGAAPAAPRAPEQTAAAPRAPQPEGTLPAGAPQQQYDQAFALLARADYDGAERALKSFLRQHPGDGLAGNAQYWLGETYYVRQDYQNAAIAFGEGYQRYPKNAKAPDNLLKLGMSLAHMNKKPEACAALGRLEQSGDAPANIKERGRRERQRIGC